jgi:hypothetical protein
MTSHTPSQELTPGMHSPAPTDPQDLGSRESVPRPVSLVVLALVVALRDVEERRGRGKVLTHLTSTRPAA